MEKSRFTVKMLAGNKIPKNCEVIGAVKTATKPLGAVLVRFDTGIYSLINDGVISSVNQQEAEDYHESLKRQISISIKGLRKIIGLTQEEFSVMYSIPRRTIQNWELGVNEAPEYLLKLLERAVQEDSNWETIKHFYQRIGRDMDCVIEDFATDFVTYCTCRNGREVIWIFSDSEEECMYTDNLEFLDEDDIEKELC